jgi:protein involved in polysaccharide export with SLBB domain
LLEKSQSGGQAEDEKPVETQTHARKDPVVVETGMEISEEQSGDDKGVRFDDEYFKKTASPEYPKLPLFGHNLFELPPSTFAPIKDIPVSSDYIIGPDDEVKVITWGLIEASYSLVVDKEGMINLPKIGQLTVGGMTFGDVKDLIKNKVEATVGVHAGVSMGTLRSIQVMVLGEVSAPGVYAVSALATVANALITCGGPTPLGSLRNVRLKRQGKTIVTLDLYDFLMKGDTSSDSRLMPGDVIFVPRVGPLVMVSGNVRRPAAYEMKSSRTLETALELAGGLSAKADNQRIQIERYLDNKKQVVVDISKAQLELKKGIAVQDGDLVRVFSILPLKQNAVFLYGNVRRPGQYAFKPGLKVSNLLPDIDSLELDTFYGYALVKRYRKQDMQAELLPFDLGALLLRKDQRQDMALMPLDEVYIFNKKMFQDEDFAVVEGQVRRPGRYTIQDMKLRDLILKAGDLTEEAYLRKGEIIRIDEKRNKHTLYFDLDAAMKGDSANNLVLRREDRVIIHSIWEDQWKEGVTVEGEVKNPGEYALTSGMRLTDLIFKAGNFTREAYLDVGHLYRTDWRSRQKTILTFNLTKALEGDPAENLVLQDLDQVVVHNISEYVDSYTVSIQGLVNRPGEYPYASNMTIKDLLIVAGNVKDAAYMDEAELVRFRIVDGKRVETSVEKFNIRLALDGDLIHNKPLEPLDVLTVKEIPHWWDKKKTVAITGEVYFPGTYQIRKNEHISDIVQRAGGYTPYAYLYGSVFTRKSVKELQKERLKELADRMEMEVARSTSKEIQTALSPEDIEAGTQFATAQKVLLEKLKAAEPTGRVVVALMPIEKLKGSTEDMVLEDGDALHIPKKPSTVTVLGAVYNPTALVYDDDRPQLRKYLAMTGGPTDNAMENAMYVIQANGTVVSSKKTAWWSDFENTRLSAGDTVLVPERVIRPSYMRDIKDISQILFQIATTAGVTALLF